MCTSGSRVSLLGRGMRTTPACSGFVGVGLGNPSLMDSMTGEEAVALSSSMVRRGYIHRLHTRTAEKEFGIQQREILSKYRKLVSLTNLVKSRSSIITFLAHPAEMSSENRPYHLRMCSSGEADRGRPTVDASFTGTPHQMVSQGRPFSNAAFVREVRFQSSISCGYMLAIPTYADQMVVMKGV